MSPKDDDESDNGNEEEKEEILGLFRAFDDVPKGANAYWAVSSLLARSGHYKDAITQLYVGLEKDPTPVQQFQILNSLAGAQLEIDDNEASKSIERCLSGRQTAPPALLREALATQGMTLAKIGGDLNRAISAFHEARQANLSEPMPGDILQHQFNVYRNKHAYAELISAVKLWTPSEKLAWMTWNSGDSNERHAFFQRAAVRCGERDFMVQTYEEVIALLDTIDSAPPVSFELATAHWQHGRDIKAAKDLLDKILDSSSSGYPFRFTNEDPGVTAPATVVLMTYLIREQFWAATDRKTKGVLFQEAKLLTERSFVRSVSFPRSDLALHYTYLAQMARKMGPATEFQDTLQHAFDLSYETLTDNVGWNDHYALPGLSLIHI